MQNIWLIFLYAVILAPKHSLMDITPLLTEAHNNAIDMAIEAIKKLHPPVIAEAVIETLKIIKQ